MEQHQWLGLPAGLRKTLLEDLQQDRLACLRGLEECRGQQDLLRLQGKYNYLRKKIDELEKFERGEKHHNDPRDPHTGY